MAKMFVPKQLRSMTSEQLQDYIDTDCVDWFYWATFVMIDYNNHSGDDDYGGGLSFINRIDKSIGWFYQWDVEELRNSIQSEKDYVRVIKGMLDDEACSMYGLHFIEKRIM